MSHKLQMRFIVTLDLNHEVTYADAADYIRDALRTWQGSLFPGDEEQNPDPMCNSIAACRVKPKGRTK
jgi:hypothetical protein